MTMRVVRALVPVLLVLVPLLIASPAGADEPEGCRRGSDDILLDGTYRSQKVGLWANGHEYLMCQDSLDGYNCWQMPSGTQNAAPDVMADADLEEVLDEDIPLLLLNPFICALDGEEIVPCRNDIRFDPVGGGDPTRAFMSGNHEGAAIMPHGAPAWWLDEVERVSGADRGQGCQLASNPPSHRLCEEIRDERNDLREEVEELERRQRAADSNPGGDPVRIYGVDPARLREAGQELHDLEHLGSIVPDPCWGRYPNSAYNLTHDASDDDLLDPSRLLFWLAQLIFGLVKTMLAVALWLVNYSLVFDVSEYRQTVADFAGRLDRNLVHLGVAELSLFNLAWFALFAGAGIRALRGRASQAGAEIMVAVALSAVAVVMVGNFFPAPDDEQFTSSVDESQNAYKGGGYFDSVSELLNLSALGLLRVGMGEDLDVGRDDMAPERVEELLVPFNEQIHREFIERPYLFIQYGSDDFDPAVSLEGENGELDCSQVKLAVLTMENPEGRWVTEFLEENGCREAADRNGTMSMQRLMDTGLVVVMALVLGGTLFVAGGTLLMAKFVTAVLFVALPLVAVVAVLPGTGRSLAWGWLTTLLQMWLAALGTGAALAFLLLGLDAVLATTGERELAEQWLIVLVLLMAVTMVRRRLIAGARSMSRALQHKLAGATAGPGGARPSWGTMHGKAPMNDVDLFSVDRGVARAGVSTRLAGGIAGAAAAGAAIGAARFTGRWTVGGVWRSQLERGARYRSAKWNQWYHWSNSQATKEVGLARSVLQGKQPDRNRAIREIRVDRSQAELAQTHGHALGETRGQARAVDAALAFRDVETLRGQQGNKPSQRLSAEARAAGQRLGFTDGELDQWHTGRNHKTARKGLLRQAERRRNDVEQLAGGRQTSPEMRRAADAAQWARNGNLDPTTRRYQDQESYQQRKRIRDLAATDGVPEDAGRRRLREIRDDAAYRLDGARRIPTREEAARFLGGED